MLAHANNDFFRNELVSKIYKDYKEYNNDHDLRSPFLASGLAAHRINNSLLQVLLSLFLFLFM